MRTLYRKNQYCPNSPYSASKAHLIILGVYFETYKIPTIITNCSNNYGPFNSRKAYTLVINNALEGKAIPIYGDGRM